MGSHSSMLLQKAVYIFHLLTSLKELCLKPYTANLTFPAAL
ncbi:hypothetical protein AVEN_185167-1, partial [Araneus ventricosus]